MTTYNYYGEKRWFERHQQLNNERNEIRYVPGKEDRLKEVEQELLYINDNCFFRWFYIAHIGRIV